MVEDFATTVDGSYSLTVTAGTSIWGIVGVIFPWGGKLVLSLLLLLLFYYYHYHYYCHYHCYKYFL